MPTTPAGQVTRGITPRGQLVLRYPAVPFLERHPHLHPGQVRAEAAVRAAAERQVPLLAPEVDRVRVRVLGRVAARDRDRDHARTSPRG